ncbi:DNRLRE domain-containing protein [Actinoplanes sp. NPDC089786]|uniref:DNRLRE domain-containing protein n=1 Tax=Actinoplanes sp. NPDC089786 TaxID=3155185 RepID=UPI003436052F
MNRRPWIRRVRIAATASLAVSIAVAAVAVTRNEKTTTEALAPLTAEGRALLAARTDGKPVKVESLTSPTTEVWAKPDGDLQAHISAGTVRMRRDGRWITIDPTLEARGDVVVPKAHPGDLVLAGERPAGDHELAAVGAGAERVAMHWTGKLPAPRLSGSEATYPEALPGVDLVVRASRTGFEQLLVVRDKAAAARIGAVRFRLSGPGAAQHVRGANGSVTLKSAAGGATMQIPQPEMWDAKLTPAGVPATTTAVRTTVERDRRGLALVLRPDARWLRDPARAYPITIDPALNPARVTFDTYVRQSTSTNAHTANDLWLGLYATDPPTIARSFITWDSAVLSGKHITSASVKFLNFWSHTCTATGWQIWTTTAANTTHTYASQPTWASAASATSTQTKGSTNCADGTVEIDGKAFFQHFAKANSALAHMGLRAQDETKTAGFKQFRSSQGAAAEVPVAVVNYQAPPLITARSTDPATSCKTGTSRPAINTLTPKLQVSVSDADANALTIDFEWYRVGETTKLGGTTINLAARTGTVFTTVPAGQFVEGGNYSWRVKVSDGVTGSSDWDKSCEFNTYLTAPPAGGCTPGAESDFNGDGVSDVAAGDPDADAGGKDGAGQVSVIYGGTRPAETVTQENVGGSSAAGDQFGRSVAAYDANNDGCADLAVGVPFKEAGSVADAGAVALILGSPAGLGRGPGTLWYTQNSTGWGDDAEAADWFGWSVTAGRTAAGEGYLVVGVPGEDVGTVIDAGLVHYVRGAVNATLYAGSGLPAPAKTDDRLGYSVAGSPHHLAFGLPGRTIGSAAFAGAVQVNTHELVSGLPKALVTIDQSTVETAEANDNFGKSVALAAYRPVGTAAGTPVSMLFVGVPGEDVDAVGDAGRVQRYKLTATALTSLGGITQNTFANGEPAEAGDYFGEKVTLVSTKPADEATAATLQAAVGVPGEDLSGVADAGLINVFGAATDPVTPSGLMVQRSSTSLPGSPADGELLGAYLGSSGGRLWVASPRQNQLHGVLWADLAAGKKTPAVTYQNPGSAIG